MQTNQFHMGDLVTIHHLCTREFDIFRKYVAEHPGRIIDYGSDVMGRVSVEFEMVHIRDVGGWIPLVYRVPPECLRHWPERTVG